jgi:protein-lysine N-methyltransferase EEF2KMT
MAMLQNDLFQLLRGYSTLVPTKDLVAPSQLPILIVHDFLLNNILLNPHFQLYPSSNEYQFSFWKWAIEWLEKHIADEAGIVFVTGSCYD